MIGKVLDFFRLPSTFIGFSALVADKLVLFALTESRQVEKAVIDGEPRGILYLSKSGAEEHLEPSSKLVVKTYKRLADIRRNNCQVGILSGQAAFALTKKHQFAHFEKVLIPMNMSMIGMVLGLFRYLRRRKLTLIGYTQLPGSRFCKNYFVLQPNVKLQECRRQFGPAGRTPLEILIDMAPIRQVCLNDVEVIEAGDHVGDLDLLVDSSDLLNLTSYLQAKIGTYPIDIYTDNGAGGFTSNRASYFVPSMARRIIDSAIASEKGIKIPTQYWQYVAFCYQMLFHKSEKIPSGVEYLNSEAVSKARYLDYLSALSKRAGMPDPKSYSDLEKVLKSAAAFPGLDLIGFHSANNEFVKSRYLSGQGLKPGLATFFIRDFGDGLKPVEEVRRQLQVHFEILLEGEVSELMRAQAFTGIRGGNWVDPNAQDGHAYPVYWFVCYDESPVKPSARTQKKHPLVDNENIRLKDDIRKVTATNNARAARMIHSSDNTLEAVDHLNHLGVSDHPVIQSHHFCRYALGKVQED